MSYPAIVCVILAAFALALPSPLFARTIRIATFNLENGVGEIGSDEYSAVRATLARIDADVIGFQELRTEDHPIWLHLAQDLPDPYDHKAFGDLGALSGGLRLAYFSRFPIAGQYSIDSPQNCPDPVVELTRAPLRVVIDVPGTIAPLVLWNMHHKAAFGAENEFRRAIEAIRIRQDIEQYRIAYPGHSEYVVLGDMNDDVADFQPVEFYSIPDGVPMSYNLGCDIQFPVSYAQFPRDAYEPAGMRMLEAYQEDTWITATRPASGRRLDYIFVSDALWANSAEIIENMEVTEVVAEIYNSALDDGVGGLPKAGLPPDPGVSAAASDHLPLFVDLEMADIPPQRLDFVGFDDDGIRLRFASMEGLLYTIQFTDGEIGEVTWTSATDFESIAGDGAVMEYFDDGAGTGMEPGDVGQRYYRLIAE